MTDHSNKLQKKSCGRCFFSASYRFLSHVGRLLIAASQNRLQPDLSWAAALQPKASTRPASLAMVSSYLNRSVLSALMLVRRLSSILFIVLVVGASATCPAHRSPRDLITLVMNGKLPGLLINFNTEIKK